MSVDVPQLVPIERGRGDEMSKGTALFEVWLGREVEIEVCQDLYSVANCCGISVPSWSRM